MTPDPDFDPDDDVLPDDAGLIPEPVRRSRDPVDMTVKVKAEGMRLDHYLPIFFPDFSRTEMRKGIDSGLITVNGKAIEEYFARPVLRLMIKQPLEAAKRETEVDVVCTVAGSGLTGQAGAVRHGIARALVEFEPDLRPAMRPQKLLTRDPRAVERKKYGKAKARRSFQFSKR